MKNPLSSIEDPVSLLKRDISQESPPSREEEKQLCTRIKQGDAAALDEMQRRNISLVIAVARQYLGKGLPLEDMISEGCIGLRHSLEKFDVERNFKFSTFGWKGIKQAILHALATQANLIAIPAYMQGKEASDKYKDQAEKARHVRGEGDLVVCKAPEDVEEFDASPLLKAVEQLKPREKVIIKAVYGLKDGREHTLKEAGEMLGITKQRAAQLRGKALAELKNLLPPA